MSPDEAMSFFTTRTIKKRAPKREPLTPLLRKTYNMYKSGISQREMAEREGVALTTIKSRFANLRSKGYRV